MITDKQFDDAFTAAGGRFILTQYEEIANWKGSKADLIELMYLKNFDKVITGAQTRVNSVLRIINNGRGKEALEKILDSKTINKQHPEAYQMALNLLHK